MFRGEHLRPYWAEQRLIRNSTKVHIYINRQTDRSESQQSSGFLTLSLKSLTGVTLQQLHLLPTDQSLLHLRDKDQGLSTAVTTLCLCWSHLLKVRIRFRVLVMVHRRAEKPAHVSHLFLWGNRYVSDEGDSSLLSLLVLPALVIIRLHRDTKQTDTFTDNGKDSWKHLECSATAENRLTSPITRWFWSES